MPQAHIHSPIGTISIVCEGQRLRMLRIAAAPPGTEDDEDPLLIEAAAQIHAWFAHRLTRFDLPLAPAVTPRGPAHRAAIADISYGATASYGLLAKRIGSSARAIGQACRNNPLPIIIPCHRVVGAGSAGFYSAGNGLDTKLWLLNHERGGRN